jgi:hypothetical protein
MADILLSDIDLEKLLILFGNSMNEKQLLLDADKDLAESEDVESAKTWLTYERYKDKTRDRIAWYMEDDLGNDADFFDPSIGGLREALEKHSETQDPMGDDEYNEFLVKIIQNIKGKDLKPIPPKIIKEFQKVSKPLEGQELLDKIQELNKSGNLSKSDKVKECGYCVMSDDGEMKLRFMDFYAAVAKAKGN